MLMRHPIVWVLLRRRLRAKMAQYEERAETAYGAMYDARPSAAKDCYDDARLLLGRAINAAERANLPGNVKRLSARRKEITEIYNRQFRGVGYS